MGKTVDDLKAKRASLVEERRRVAYRIHTNNLEELAHLHLAILALDAAIDEGQDEPEPRDSTAMFL